MKDDFEFRNLRKEEMQKVLEKYFPKYHQEKMKFNAPVDSFNNEIIRFGMRKHYGVIRMDINNLSEFL